MPASSAKRSRCAVSHVFNLANKRTARPERRAAVLRGQASNGHEPVTGRPIRMSEAHTTTEAKPCYRRVLLKLSGEALAPPNASGIDPDALQAIATEVKDVAALGI